jgi:hypothetical protein
MARVKATSMGCSDEISEGFPAFRMMGLEKIFNSPLQDYRQTYIYQANNGIPRNQGIRTGIN